MPLRSWIAARLSQEERLPQPNVQIEEWLATTNA